MSQYFYIYGYEKYSVVCVCFYYLMSVIEFKLKEV